MNLKNIMDSLPCLSNNKKVLIALSGGLDSTILMHLLVSKYGNKNVIAVSFNYGQRHSIELEKAKNSAKRLDVKHFVLDISFFKDIVKSKCSLVDNSEVELKNAGEEKGQPNSYVPFRNFMFASLQASIAETNNCEFIASGIQKQDFYGYWDCRPNFMNALNEVLKCNDSYNLKFIAPFVNLMKYQELELAKELSKQFGFDILEFTWSCYDASSNKECGKCNTCVDSSNAFYKAGYSKDYILKKYNVFNLKD